MRIAFMRGIVRRILLLAVLAGASGCYVTAPLKPSQLTLLDGYQDGEPKGGPVYLLSPTDQKVEVASGSKIYLDVAGTTYGGDFKSIRVTDGFFDGVTRQGLPVQVPLGSIQAARVNEPNRPAKALVVVVLSIAGTILLGAAALTLFMRAPTEGRALRIGNRVVTAPAVKTGGWDADWQIVSTASLEPKLREVLARLWTETARGEHASIPAFSRLALSLVSLGAPARLVEAAHRAALEEVEHARLAFSLARAYADTAIGPGPLSELASAPAVTVTSLGELAAESLIDGCLLEGVAAEVARRAVARVRDRDARAALSVIARDETSHAQLAWDVVIWCCQEGGDRVPRQLLAALGRAPKSVSGPRFSEELADVLADHGWLGPQVWKDAFRQTLATVSRRVAALGASQGHDQVA
jgi:hypothetical protein